MVRMERVAYRSSAGDAEAQSVRPRRIGIAATVKLRSYQAVAGLSSDGGWWILNVRKP